MAQKTRRGNKALGKGKATDIADAKRVAPTAKAGGKVRQLNTRPDGLDFRDLMYAPTLVEAVSYTHLDVYKRQ